MRRAQFLKIDFVLVTPPKGIFESEFLLSAKESFFQYKTAKNCIEGDRKLGVENKLRLCHASHGDLRECAQKEQWNFLEALGRVSRRRAVQAKRVSWQLHSNLHLDTNFCRFISGNEDFLIDGKNSLGVTEEPTVIFDRLKLTGSYRNTTIFSITKPTTQNGVLF